MGVAYMLPVYELRQLTKRQMAQKQQRQVMPINSDSHQRALQTTSAVADTVLATQQALLSGERLRRDSSASLVLGAGVSLAFLETFIRENSIKETATANDAVNKHVKPCTEKTGLDGSGAFVELIGDGVDINGQLWCSTPTHMLSYSWSYSMGTIAAGLQKFELEHPPKKGQCHYYFIDQVKFLTLYASLIILCACPRALIGVHSSRSTSTRSPRTARRSR
jgi:hypothetical protein